MVFMNVTVVENDTYVERLCKLSELVIMSLMAQFRPKAAGGRRTSDATRLVQGQIQSHQRGHVVACDLRPLGLGEWFRSRSKVGGARHKVVNIIIEGKGLLFLKATDVGREAECGGGL